MPVEILPSPPPGPSSLREDPRRPERVYDRTQRRNRYRSRPPRPDWGGKPAQRLEPRASEFELSQARGGLCHQNMLCCAAICRQPGGPIGATRCSPRRPPCSKTPADSTLTRFAPYRAASADLLTISAISLAPFEAELVSSRLEKRTANTAAAAAAVGCGVYVSGPSCRTSCSRVATVIRSLPFNSGGLVLLRHTPTR